MAIEPISAGIGFLGDVVGGLFGSSAQDRANASNEKIAADNRAFQMNASSTAHQREREDLEKAGYNPMLGAMKGGASSPSGSTATIQASNPMSGLSSGVNSALSSASLVQDIENKQTSQALTTAQTATEGARAIQTANSAKESAIRTATIEAELPAKQKHGKYDSDYAGLDAAISRATNAAKLGSTAMDMIPGSGTVGKILKFLKPKPSGKPIDPDYSGSIGGAMDKFLNK
nr:MAG: DNA pilot protein [Microvirus sp.]QJB19666.1 MAG: DNA pilot protein [Microvirus sp.]